MFIRSVTNLSDARYCAGMGVEMIGFCVEQTHPDFVNEMTIQGITGWISGVKIVAELDVANNEELITSLNPDMLCLHVESAKLTNREIIYRFSLDEIPEIMPEPGSLLLIESIDTEDLKIHYSFIRTLADSFKVILGFGFDTLTIHDLYTDLHLYGFSMKGGKEIAPGLKTFDELAEILEIIEV